MTDITLLFDNFIGLFIESAPWLLLGLLVAGIMHELVPVSLLQKHMGNNSVGAIFKAAVIGAPLPLCSCGVIPAALGLRRSGASKPATVSFLVSTPETGVDSVSVSYALLGPLFAIVRPVAAIFSAIYTGLMVKFFAEPDERKQQDAPAINTNQCAESAAKPAMATSTCCSTAPKENPVSSCATTQAPNDTAQSDGCCSSKSSPKNTSATKPLGAKITTLLQFSTGKLLQDITLWLLIGLALAAAIQTWVPTSFLTQWGDGFMAMLVMAVIGVPMYICATASTPLAVGFLSAGLSPGAILVFMLAGPATNVSTMGMIGKELGRRALILYIFSITSASIGFGYLLNYLVDTFALTQFIAHPVSGHHHGETVGHLYTLCGIVLAGLIIKNYLQKSFNKGTGTAKSSAQSCH
ncbi:SO_0444 family Cu/Zn efflux transporter [Alteromonas sp. C1M14]|uniref:SO_0444 family Cu/Zn efflux transporter n=1 Tax=Alteromonas sp. C1M14 TaxID=2841567 RepID=UPI001C09967B|nr:SO_0444 family Cu/Zn efflux transporter [Alteromonas sp. C1M14]MBU2977749.1 SO_0444 family Cu/Zn efflux transporter [Alteromonas sp. C1M14]